MDNFYIVATKSAARYSNIKNFILFMSDNISTNNTAINRSGVKKSFKKVNQVSTINFVNFMLKNIAESL